MPLSADNIVHSNSGTSASGTSVNVALTGGDSTTAGNTVLVFMTSPATVTPPAGFVTDKTSAGIYVVCRKSEVAASETSWTFTLSSSTVANWYVMEVSNLDIVDPFDATASNGPSSVSNGGTLSSGTTGLNAGLSSLCFAFYVTTSLTTVSWSGYTNGFTELIDTGTFSNTQYSLAVAWQNKDGSTGTFESTATLASSGSTTSYGAAVVYRAADAPVVAPLAGIWGFEWGTHAGLGHSSSTGLTGTGALGTGGTYGTNFLIQASSARNSSYGLRIVGGASGGYVLLFTPAGYTSLVVGMNVRAVSATTNPATVAVMLNPNGSLYLLYNVSTTKFGVRWGTGGTTSWQSGTTALNAWTYVQLRMKCNTATYHVDWRIETGNGTSDETSPADHSAGTSQEMANIQLGSSSSETATFDFDDVIMSRYYAVWPLGVHQVRLLVPETTGASVSGTSTNFSEFTANGTLAAFASTSGQRIDEVPPTVSASSDGVVQTAVAASDYMNFPMGTYTCAADEMIAAVRALFSEWGGTGSGTGTIGYRGYDGTTETTFQAASASYDADSLTTASATYPRWMCAMWPSTNGWTQTELNAAALRVGFSTDATPDMGISAAYLEVAIKKLGSVRQITVEDPISATVDLYVHSYTSATVSYVITNNDATRSVNFNYSISGTPQTPVTVTASSNQTVQLNADAFGDISDVSLEVI